MMILGCILLKGNDSFAATTYKDWSEMQIMNKDYSYSTMFFSNTTEIRVLKNGEKLNWKEINGIAIPEIKLEEGEEAVLLITDCAVDKDGKASDVVIKIDQVTRWRTKQEW